MASIKKAIALNTSQPLRFWLGAFIYELRPHNDLVMARAGEQLGIIKFTSSNHTAAA